MLYKVLPQSSLYIDQLIDQKHLKVTIAVSNNCSSEEMFGSTKMPYFPVSLYVEW